jgi:hypothetical protein
VSTLTRAMNSMAGIFFDIVVKCLYACQ